MQLNLKDKRVNLRELKINQQCNFAAEKTNSILGYVTRI